MPYLILPPTQFLADNQEVPNLIAAQAKSYQKNILDELQLKAPIATVTIDAYKGTQVFEWQQKYNGILLTNIVYEKNKQFKNEWFKTASLIKQDDCTVLGSIWNYTDKKNIPFVIENSQLKISDIVSRTFKILSPIKIEINEDNFDARRSFIFNLVLQESLTKKNILTVSNGGRFFCKAKNLNNIILKNETLFPSKPHRIFNVKVTAIGNKINYHAQLNGAAFAQKSDKWDEKKDNQDFAPEKIAEDLSEKIIPALDDFSKNGFKIVKRFGSWVYLNRGFAFGLKIGMRLVGKNGATLHIIRYAPKLEGEMDGAIAFIRHESPENPLAINDILKMDPAFGPG